jgi:serine/threonine protein kinase
VDDGALSAERCFGRPATNRRAYAVDDVAGLREDDSTVVRAERLPTPDEPDEYAGPVSLKLHTDASTIDAPQLAARLDAVAAVRHPNLGRPIEAFVGPGLARRPEDADTADDVFYVAARWEDGRPLRLTVPMAPLAAIAVVRGVAGAVDALHGHGLTHRDLHPGNVFVRPDGSPVVIVFD